jgi:Type I phosphodiesterase / nucleotide pyrophosphatase
LSTEPRPRLLLLSLDGLGHHTLLEDPAARVLPDLHRTIRDGALADGMVSTFPTQTATAHATLWTGVSPARHGITGNLPAPSPRALHTPQERVSGFGADNLAAEPIWATAARNGLPSVAHQTPQGFPFLPINTACGSKVPLLIINSRQTEPKIDHAVIRRRDTEDQPCIWISPAVGRSRREPRYLSWSVSGMLFHGVMVAESGPAYDALWIASNPKETWVHVPARAEESIPPLDRALARHFSSPLPVRMPDGANVSISFRLFELATDGEDFVLYQSAAPACAVYDGGINSTLTGFDHQACSAALGLYVAGAFGAPGEGKPERRYLETVELSIERASRQSEWLWRSCGPRLLVDYCEFPDEFEHVWFGLAASREHFQFCREWAFAALNRRVSNATALAGDQDYVILLSDHGIASAAKEIRINIILQQAGLQRRAADGSIDIGQSEAFYSNFAVTINTDDWKHGCVPRRRRASVLRQVEQALASVRDPDCGLDVFQKFYPAGSLPGCGVNLQLGATLGDLWFDLAPGYTPLDGIKGEAIVRRHVPMGIHGLPPLRRDMLAFFAVKGPGIGRGSRLQRIRSVDVAPLIAGLLGFRTMPRYEGRSPI